MFLKCKTVTSPAVMEVLQLQTVKMNQVLEYRCLYLCKLMTSFLLLHSLQSNLVNTTLVYTTPLILRHILVTKLFSSKLPLLYVYDTIYVTFRISVLSY